MMSKVKSIFRFTLCIHVYFFPWRLYIFITIGSMVHRNKMFSYTALRAHQWISCALPRCSRAHAVLPVQATA